MDRRSSSRSRKSFGKGKKIIISNPIPQYNFSERTSFQDRPIRHHPNYLASNDLDADSFLARFQYPPPPPPPPPPPLPPAPSPPVIKSYSYTVPSPPPQPRHRNHDTDKTDPQKRLSATSEHSLASSLNSSNVLGGGSSSSIHSRPTSPPMQANMARMYRAGSVQKVEVLSPTLSSFDEVIDAKGRPSSKPLITNVIGTSHAGGTSGGSGSVLGAGRDYLASMRSKRQAGKETKIKQANAQQRHPDHHPLSHLGMGAAITMVTRPRSKSRGGKGKAKKDKSAAIKVGTSIISAPQQLSAHAYAEKGFTNPEDYSSRTKLFALAPLRRLSTAQVVAAAVADVKYPVIDRFGGVVEDSEKQDIMRELRRSQRRTSEIRKSIAIANGDENVHREMYGEDPATENSKTPWSPQVRPSNDLSYEREDGGANDASSSYYSDESLPESSTGEEQNNNNITLISSVDPVDVEKKTQQSLPQAPSPAVVSEKLTALHNRSNASPSQPCRVCGSPDTLETGLCAGCSVELNHSRSVASPAPVHCANNARSRSRPRQHQEGHAKQHPYMPHPPPPTYPQQPAQKKGKEREKLARIEAWVTQQVEHSPDHSKESSQSPSPSRGLPRNPDVVLANAYHLGQQRGRGKHYNATLAQAATPAASAAINAVSRNRIPSSERLERMTQWPAPLAVNQSAASTLPSLPTTSEFSCVDGVGEPLTFQPTTTWTATPHVEVSASTSMQRNPKQSRETDLDATIRHDQTHEDSEDDTGFHGWQMYLSKTRANNLFRPRSRSRDSSQDGDVAPDEIIIHHDVAKATVGNDYDDEDEKDRHIDLFTAWQRADERARLRVDPQHHKESTNWDRPYNNEQHYPKHPHDYYDDITNAGNQYQAYGLRYDWCDDNGHHETYHEEIAPVDNDHCEISGRLASPCAEGGRDVSVERGRRRTRDAGPATSAFLSAAFGMPADAGGCNAGASDKTYGQRSKGLEADGTGLQPNGEEGRKTNIRLSEVLDLYYGDMF